MDIIGKWKVNKVLQMGDAGSEWRTRDEVKDVEPEDVDDADADDEADEDDDDEIDEVD